MGPGQVEVPFPEKVRKTQGESEVEGRDRATGEVGVKEISSVGAPGATFRGKMNQKPAFWPDKIRVRHDSVETRGVSELTNFPTNARCQASHHSSLSYQ